MCIHRTELRAFPRLSCATPAQLQIGEAVEQAGQVIDVSSGGCKVLPSRLAPLVEQEFPPGTAITVTVAGFSVTGVLVWATPNFSALGCAFHEAITQPLVDFIAKASFAAAE